MRVRAFAKINLSLRVLGTRTDGYHELRTLFQSIELHDTLVVRRARGPLRFTCNDPLLPVDRANLVVRAAEAVWTASGRRGAPRDIAIDLAKRIPVAAGLCGGSSDAAAALRALGTRWKLDGSRLHALAASLGADVPYFLEGGTALGLDRGDLLFPLIDYPSAWVVLVVPPFGVSTQEAYAWWDHDEGRAFPASARSQDERATARLAEAPEARRRQVSRRSAESLALHEVGNDLQAPVATRHPEIAGMVSALRRAGASSAAMSGSGPAVFGLFNARSAAVRATAAMPTRAGRALVTRTLTRAEYRRLAAN